MEFWSIPFNLVEYANLGIILATGLFEASSRWKANSVFQACADTFPSRFFLCVSLGAGRGEAHLVSVLASGSCWPLLALTLLRAVTDDQVL